MGIQIVPIPTLADVLAQGNISGVSDLIISTGATLVVDGALTGLTDLTVSGSATITNLAVDGFLTMGGSSILRFNQGGKIQFTGGTGNNFIEGNVENSGRIGVFTENIERLTVLLGGNVGIGNTNPSQKLNVNGSANISSDLFVGGNVGVGTNTPNNKLHVSTPGAVPVYTGVNRGIIISDNIGPRVAFEDTAAAVDAKTIIQKWEAGNFSFSTINDVGSAFLIENIISIEGATGNVGIGTPTPLAKLDIATSGDGAKILRLSTDRAWEFKQINTGSNTRLALHSTVDGKAFDITDITDAILASFLTSTTGPQITLVPSGGKVGIGTSSPVQSLDVDGVIRSKDHRLIAGSKLILDDTAFGNANISTLSAGSKTILFTTDSLEAMRIDALGNVGIGTTTPFIGSVLSIVNASAKISGAQDAGGTGKWDIETVSGVVRIGSTFPTNLALKTNDVNRLFISTIGNVGIGTASPDSSAILDVASITKGSIPAPRMTTAEKNAITSPATGLRVFDTDINRHEFFDGSVWKGLEQGPLNVVYFTEPSQLPAPIGGVITLEENTTYVMYNDDPSVSQKQVTFLDRIQIPDTGGCRITSVGVGTVILAYTGTGAFITTSKNFTGFLNMDTLFVTCPNGTLFDIDGVNPVGQEFFPRIFLNDLGVFDTDTLGTIKTINANFNVGAFFSCKQGLVVDGVEELLIGDWRFANWQNDVGSVMLTVKNQLRFPKISNCTFETRANETAFDISPSIGDEDFIIAGNSYRGTGALYATGISLTSTQYANASQVGTVTAVSGTPFGESIMTEVAHGLVKGQIITTTGFTDPNYNGTFEILEIVDADNFRIHTLFTATGSGSYTSDVLRISHVEHGLSIGDGVQLIPDDFSTGYQGGYIVIGSLADFFFVNATFTSDGTGSFNTDSLTETDPRMRVVANAGMPDSNTIGSYLVNGNATATSLTSGVWTDLDLGGNVVAGSNIERFIVTNTTTGEIRYVGAEEFSGIIGFTAYASSTGGARDFQMRAIKNGSVLPDTLEPTQSVGSDFEHFQITVPITLVNGDLIRPQALRVDGTSTLTVSHLSMIIK